ncbi:MAG: trypsin-like peptidase domain-containing protein [Cyanobacteria bacterium SZAS LIN-2]|nr:trypsin-like peptidase domain-containing protein [Cyanobacteria bacterium SZAS LIN-2]
MTDKPSSAHDLARDQSQPITNPDSSSKILFDDSHSGKTIGRFNPQGESLACKSNPPEGTVPSLMPGQNTHGCDFKGMKDLPKGISHLDFPNIYNEAAPSSVRFDAKLSSPGDPNPKHVQDGPMGSGAMIGKDVKNGECLVATANHVVSGDKSTNISNVRGITADGSTYQAEVRHQDPKRDTAVVALHTGADTDKVCKPFTPVQDVNKEAAKNTPVVSLGFAEGSRALYASPGTSVGIHRLREDMSPANIRQLGLDLNGSQLKLNNHVRGGQSGGPVVTNEGKLAGLNQSGPDDSRHSSAVPIDQKRVDELLARSMKKP